MATQICPNCNEDSFTWSMDDEISNLTMWGCYKCHYQAFENEEYERVCANCHNGSQLQLKDDEKMYWWCSKCNTIEPIKFK